MRVCLAGVPGVQTRQPGHGSRTSHLETLVRRLGMSAKLHIVDICNKANMYGNI